MTEEFYRTGNHKVSHSTFGGYVYQYDFEGYNSMTEIASRIMSDFRFDRSCRKNENYRKNRIRKEKD